MKRVDKIRWSPRVSRQKIRLLYEKDAQGIVDEDLINEVAFSFYARCLDILTVTEAAKGRIKCLKCDHIITHQWKKDEIIKCEKCSWETSWGDYSSSYKGKQLHAGLVEEVFKEFVTKLPKAQTTKEKMILIDTIIHQCHKWLNPELNEYTYHRPIAVNLIEGKMTKIIELLNSLAEGQENTEGVKERREFWKKRTDRYTKIKFGKIIE